MKMSKFNHYSMELDTKARELLETIKKANKEIEYAESKVQEYPKKAVLDMQYDTEYEANRLKYEAMLARAKADKQKAYTEGLQALKAFYQSEREKLKTELDNFYALDPQTLSPETLEILNSKAATANDYKRLFEIAQANGNITMIRLIGAKADEKSNDYKDSPKTEGIENYKICRTLAEIAKGYTGEVKLGDYDSQYEILTKCIDINRPSSIKLFDYYNSEIYPSLQEGF